MDFSFHGGEIKEKIKYDFSVNINPLGMPARVSQAILENVSAFSEYPDRNSLDLKSEIARVENISDSQVLCGNGASELIMAVCAYVSGSVRGEQAHINAIMCAPTFFGYERAVKAYDGEVNYFDTTKALLDIIEAGKKQNLLFICNPNNPTGEVTKKHKLREILDEAKERNILVLVDECFIDFTHEESMTDCIDEYDNLIVLKAMTKFYALAGVRLGYIMAQSKLCEKIAKYLPEWNVSTLAQIAGKEALRADGWKEKTLKLVDTEREWLKSELGKMKIEVSDSQANFLLCKCKIHDIWTKLKDKGILVRDCRNFVSLDDSYIRVCVSTHDRNEILINALKELCNG